jgi:cysteinyl-tRNA synthetase
MFPILFSGNTDATKDAKPPLMLFNTMSRSKERFVPLRDDFVRMYNCGPTVYDFAHIGNLRSYVFADILRRTLLLNGYKVLQVVNITDVGHLTSDADEGDDKMTVGLKREGLSFTLEGMKQLADRYTQAFMEDLASLNVRTPSVLPRASEHVHAQIALISTLIEKEYAYRTGDGVYFDTSKFKEYGKLGAVDLGAQREGARVEKNVAKRNPADFEAATGKPFARYWMHNEHIHIEGTKFSKSLGNAVKLRQLVEHGYSPLAYRYWLLSGHYRTPMNFSWIALDGAQTALIRLHRHFVEHLVTVRSGAVDERYRLEFLQAVNNDLDTPKALALLWELVKDETVPEDVKRATLLHFDKVLALGLSELAQSGAASIQIFVKETALDDLPSEARALVDAREAARAAKDWPRADELRQQLTSAGYTIEDSSEGPKITRIHASE